MRNILDLINERHGKEVIAIFRKYERLNMKICNFKKITEDSLSGAWVMTWYQWV